MNRLTSSGILAVLVFRCHCGFVDTLVFFTEKNLEYNIEKFRKGECVKNERMHIMIVYRYYFSCYSTRFTKLLLSASLGVDIDSILNGGKVLNWLGFPFLHLPTRNNRSIPQNVNDQSEKFKGRSVNGRNRP